MTAGPEDVDALRTRLRELEDQLAESESARADEQPARRSRGWLRTAGAVACLVLVFVLAPLSVVAQWAHDEVGDTDRYVETVAPLAQDPAVQAALADRITEEIVVAINVDEVTSEALTALASQSFIPDRAAGLLPGLSVPLSTAIEDYVHRIVTRVVESPTFEQAWAEANRTAHEQMVALLTGETGGSVQVDDDGVKINIAAFVEAAKQLMLDEGFRIAQRIPEVDATFTVFQSAEVGKAQRAFALLDSLARVLPVLVLLLVFLAVWLSTDRRRTWVAAGLTVAASMLLLGLGLNLARPLYLDAVPAEILPGAAAAAIYDALTHFLRLALRAVLAVSLVVAVAALLMAPTGAGAAIRTGISSGLGRLRRSARGAGADTGAVGSFLGTYQVFARVTIVAVGALVYLSVDHPTAVTAFTIVGAIVLLLVLLELIAVPPSEQQQADDPEGASVEEVTSGQQPPQG